MTRDLCRSGLVWLGLYFGTLVLQGAEAPLLRIDRETVSEAQLTWPSSADGFILEEAEVVTGPWQPSALVSQREGDRQIVRIGAGERHRYFRLRGEEREALTVIRGSSPAAEEEEVSVTRETIVYFSRPLASDSVLGTNQFYALAAGRRLLTRIELSSDGQKATLFQQENLPAGSQVEVFLRGDGLKDHLGREVDGDRDGRPGGTHRLVFSTLSTAPIAQTAVIGHVYASEPVPDAPGSGRMVNQPLEGVTITVDGMEESLRTTTDANGFFRLAPSPAGRFFVHVDGRTAQGSQWPGGQYYPFIGKAWEAVAGIETNLAGGNGEIYLPLIRAGSLQAVSPTAPTAITFPAEVIASQPALQGVTVTVPPNTLFSENGLRGGRVGLAPVAPDRLPEPLPQGLNLPLVITIQTDGPQNFDRPVPVRFPNLPDPLTGQKLPPGAKSALWSFNHDKGAWEIAGPMTVTADGNFVESDPGYGVLQPGWHGTQPGSSAGNDEVGNDDGNDGDDDGDGSDGDDDEEGGNGNGGGPEGGGPDDEGSSGGSTGSDEGSTGTDGGNDSDSDGDGTSDSTDGDIDGDGTSNDQDSDIDGDGVENEADNDDDGDLVRDTDDSSPTGNGGSRTAACGGGVDCNCDLAGSYVDPQVASPKVLADGRSPNNRYQLSAAPGQGNSVDITIRRISNNQLVLHVNIPSLNAAWGFAPDGDAFVYHFVTGPLGGQMHTVFVHNLARPNPAVPIWNIQKVATPSGLGFSPHGHFFIYTTGVGNNTFEIYISSAANGEVRHFHSFTTGSAGWGFSPDCSDRSFILAYTSGPNSVEWKLVNLHSKQMVHQETITGGGAGWNFNAATGAWNFSPLSGFWQFSPCGDVAGLVIGAGGEINVKLIPTRAAGLPLVASRSFPLSSVSLLVNAESHLAQVGTRLELLGQNKADNPCDPQAASRRPALPRRAPALLPPKPKFQRSLGLHYYALKDWSRGQIVQRGIAGRAGIAHINLILRPNTPYRNYVLKAETLELGYVDFISGENGQNIKLPNVNLIRENSPDTDGDGLSALAELIMGTNPAQADSDGDGVPDGEEVRQGADPNSGLAVRTGVIAALDTPGTAVDVAIINNLAAVADRQGGVALFDVSTGLNPRLLRQIDTAGSAEAVAFGNRFLAAADLSGGLAIIDISPPSEAILKQQVSLGSDARSVAAAGDIAYVGLASGQIAVVDMAGGGVLERINAAPAAIQDLAIEGDMLYAYTLGRLYLIPLEEGELRVASSIASPGDQGAGLRRLRLFVGDNRAYATHTSGYNLFDLSNPNAPRLVLAHTTPQRGWKQIVANGSGLGIAAVDANSTDDGAHDIGLYSLGSDGTGTDFQGMLATPGLAHAVSLYNGLALVADGPQGLQVINYRERDTAGQPPAITLVPSFPLDPPRAEEGKLVRLAARVTDDVQVRNVEFYLDGRLMATDGNFPFEVRLVTPLRSALKTSFSLRAKATDTGGNSRWTEEMVVALSADATPPRVIGRYPASGAILGEVGAVLARWSEPVQLATLQAGAFRLRGAGPDSILGTGDDLLFLNGRLEYEAAARTARLAFNGSLPAGLYEAAVLPPLADLAGNVLAGEIRWTFWVLGQSDQDADGVPDNIEQALGLDPNHPDTDRDGILDGAEDLDQDSLATGWELVFGYDPRQRDSDGNGTPDHLEDPDQDGLRNSDEVRFRSSPRNSDSDGDGWDDNGESLEGTDPASASSEPSVMVVSAFAIFLNALPETPAPDTLIPVVSAPVSYLNALPERPAPEFEAPVFSPSVSYLNAQPEDFSDLFFLISPVVSYQNQ